MGQFPQINVGAAEAAPIAAANLSNYLDKKHVSISLRYYQRSCECFSKWQGPELKKFSSTIEKIRGYTPEVLKVTYSLCVIHKGDPAEERFSLPDDISPDQALYELKVDPSNKARVHGFFYDAVFFLIWLDREHACFPSK